MASIEFDDKTLKKVKSGMGVYRQLTQTPINEEDAIWIKELRKNLIILIEDAFRKYAKTHRNCSKELEDKEWNQFLKFLRKKL